GDGPAHLRGARGRDRPQARRRITRLLRRHRAHRLGRLARHGAAVPRVALRQGRGRRLLERPAHGSAVRRAGQRAQDRGAVPAAPRVRPHALFRGLPAGGGDGRAGARRAALRTDEAGGVGNRGLRRGAAAAGGPRGTDVEPGGVPDPAQSAGPAARVPDDSGARERGIPALREHPPERVHQLAARAHGPLVGQGRSDAAVRGAADGRRGLHRVRRHGDPRRRESGAVARGRRPRRAAAHHDARRAVPVRAHCRPRALPADERQLRSARAARAGGEGQTEKAGAAGRAGAPRHRRVRPGCRRRGDGVSSEIADFVTFLEKERNDSPHTVKAYARDVADFAAFCTQYYGGAAWSFAGVDRLAIRGWLGAMQQRGLAKRSAARALSALRTFYRFLNTTRGLEVNPAKAARTPRLERTLPEHLDRDETERVFVEAERRAAAGGFTEARDLAMLELFYSTGIRL